MISSLNKKLEVIDLLIRKAQGNAAQKALRQIKRKEIKLEFLAAVAALAVRANLPKLALSLLRPIVAPSKKFIRPPTHQELAEYAMALARLGADSEARELLDKIDTTAVPIALSYKGILAMKRWDYAEAVPFLQEYLSREPDRYFQINAISNLIQCLSYLKRFTEIDPLLTELRTYAEQNRMFGLQANVHRYLGIAEFYSNRYPQAEAHFNRSLGLLSVTNSLEQFFTRKWLAITHAFLSKGSVAACQELAQVENEAITRRHWETVRDLEYHRAILFNDRKRALSLYFGTPHKSFRDRLLLSFPDLPVEVPFLWHLGPTAPGPRRLVELDHQRPTTKGDFLKVGQAMHRLYIALCSDFYKPFSVVTLFDKVFPGELYTGESCRYRIFQGVKRLRQWLLVNKIPLEIKSTNGEYTFSTRQPVSVAISPHSETSAGSSIQFRLMAIYKSLGKEFRIVDVVGLLKISRTSVTELIEEASKQGIVEHVGVGKLTRYRFASIIYKKTA